METSVVAVYVREGKTMTERQRHTNSTVQPSLMRSKRTCLLAAGTPVLGLLGLELGQTVS